MLIKTSIECVLCTRENFGVFLSSQVKISLLTHSYYDLQLYGNEYLVETA